MYMQLFRILYGEKGGFVKVLSQSFPVRTAVLAVWDSSPGSMGLQS